MRIIGKIVLASAAVVAALMLLGLVVGPAQPPTTTGTAPVVAERPPGVLPTPQPAPVPDLELLGVPQGIESPTGMEIVGRVRNNRATTYRYAQISFTVANPQGEQVGSAMANINNLEAGAVWKFRAVSLAQGGTRFKLASLSGR